jgi:chemotaxis protein MotB
MAERGKVFKWVVFLVSLGFIYGCAGNRKALEEQVTYQNETIEELKRTNTDLQTKLAEKDAQLQQAAQQPASKLESFKGSLESQLRGTGVTVGIRGNEIVISLPSGRLFAPGQHTLRPEAKRALNKVSSAVKAQLPGATVRVEGHTDNQPIKKQKDRFQSNWELSAARASSVLHYLVDKCHMDPKRVYMAGRGEYHPVANNSTPSGRQKNRRVELVILPQEGT